jgi:hypothetical protein
VSAQVKGTVPQDFLLQVFSMREEYSWKKHDPANFKDIHMNSFEIKATFIFFIL